MNRPHRESCIASGFAPQSFGGICHLLKPFAFRGCGRIISRDFIGAKVRGADSPDGSFLVLRRCGFGGCGSQAQSRVRCADVQFSGHFARARRLFFGSTAPQAKIPKPADFNDSEENRDRIRLKRREERSFEIENDVKTEPAAKAAG